MRNSDLIRRAGELKAQGLTLEVIAIRLCVSKGQASKLIKRARDFCDQTQDGLATDPNMSSSQSTARPDGRREGRTLNSVFPEPTLER